MIQLVGDQWCFQCPQKAARHCLADFLFRVVAAIGTSSLTQQTILEITFSASERLT